MRIRNDTDLPWGRIDEFGRYTDQDPSRSAVTIPVCTDIILNPQSKRLSIDEDYILHVESKRNRKPKGRSGTPSFFEWRVRKILYFLCAKKERVDNRFDGYEQPNTRRFDCQGSLIVGNPVLLEGTELILSCASVTYLRVLLERDTVSVSA